MFLKIALINSQTRRPKLTRSSSRLRPLLWFSPGKHAKGKDVRACLHGSELLCYFFGLFFCLIGGPRGGNGGSLGQRSIERVPSSTASSRPAVPGAATERQKKGRYEFCRSSLSLLLPHEQTRWQPFLWQFRLMKEDFSQRSNLSPEKTYKH